MREREQHDAADEEQHLARQLGDPRAQQRLKHREVRRQPARELAGPALGEEAGRQPHEMREHVLAQLRDHPLGRAREQVDLHEVHRALQREREDEPERDPVEQRTVALLERGVEQVAHDEREREADRRRDDEADGADGEPARVRPDPRHDARERCERDGLLRARDDAPRERGVAAWTGHVTVLDCLRVAATVALRRAIDSSSAPPRSAPRSTAAAPSRARRAPRGGALQSDADQTRTCTTPSSPGMPTSSSVSGAPAPAPSSTGSSPVAAPAAPAARFRCGVTPLPDRRPSPRTAARDTAARTCTAPTPASGTPPRASRARRRSGATRRAAPP